jgi:superfamily II DNA or RNA helicase
MKKLRPYQIKALDALKTHNRGICVLPTGSGKTTIFIEDVYQKCIQSQSPLTVVVVAPIILLSNQLEEEFRETIHNRVEYFTILVHSGEGGTTNPEQIKLNSNLFKMMNKHQIIFTTYRSLPKILEAGIKIDIAIFDEAHHSTKESNFVGVAHTSRIADNTYFYTATPRDTKDLKSMLNSDVYGGTIYKLSPKELVQDGYILPPKVETYQASIDDAENVINFVESVDANAKVLVASHSTKSLFKMFSESNLLEELKDRGYQVLHITSKYGAIVNGKKVSRPEFFSVMNKLCSDENSKVIIFHVAILSEGISVPGITHILMLRNLGIMEMAQTIGRAIRLHKKDVEAIEKGHIKLGDFSQYRKSVGVISVPINDTRGDRIHRRLTSVIDTLFRDGTILMAST